MIQQGSESTHESKKLNKIKKDEEEDGYEGSASSIENPINLPRPIINRVNALKNIQLKMVNIESKFYEELHQLECKYAALYEPLYDQRVKIVDGEHEPTLEEIKWIYEDIFSNSNEKEITNLADDLKEKATLSDSESKDIKGIPGFWLQAFKNTDIIGEMIQEHDEPVLKYLRDVRVRMNSQKPYGYTIEFHFNDNEYFTDKVLTKSYELAIDLNQDDKDPLSYDGPIIYKCQGCTINWVKGKDVTVKLVKKKQKHKATGTIRVVTKEEKQDSFFNFFDTPTHDGLRPSYRQYVKKETNQQNDEEDEMDDDLEQLCEADFELGHFFKEFMIPKAVLYFTGELVDEANGYDDEFEDDEEDYDDEEENENDDDENDLIDDGLNSNKQNQINKNSNNKGKSTMAVKRK